LVLFDIEYEILKFGKVCITYNVQYDCDEETSKLSSFHCMLTVLMHLIIITWGLLVYISSF